MKNQFNGERNVQVRHSAAAAATAANAVHVAACLFTTHGFCLPHSLPGPACLPVLSAHPPPQPPPLPAACPATGAVSVPDLTWCTPTLCPPDKENKHLNKLFVAVFRHCCSL
jgi:hypothetical protein